MTLKEEFWKDGNIFRMSTGVYRMVWGDKLIDACGYIAGSKISDYLYNTDSTINEHVIEVYAPNWDAGYFKELIKPTTAPIWKADGLVITKSELLKALGISKDQKIFIVDE